MAEEEGFEPSERGYRSTVFKTAAFNHSATPPGVQAVLSYPISPVSHHDTLEGKPWIP